MLFLLVHKTCEQQHIPKEGRQVALHCNKYFTISLDGCRLYTQGTYAELATHDIYLYRTARASLLPLLALGAQLVKDNYGVTGLEVLQGITQYEQWRDFFWRPRNYIKVTSTVQLSAREGYDKVCDCQWFCSESATETFSSVVSKGREHGKDCECYFCKRPHKDSDTQTQTIPITLVTDC